MAGGGVCHLAAGGLCLASRLGSSAGDSSPVLASSRASVLQCQSALAVVYTGASRWIERVGSSFCCRWIDRAMLRLLLLLGRWLNAGFGQRFVQDIGHTAGIVIKTQPLFNDLPPHTSHPLRPARFGQ